MRILKVNISLDDELMKRTDNYADKNYMSRSGLISLALTQYLNGNEMIIAVKDIALSIRKMADNNTVDAEALEQLEDFERVCKMFTGKQ